MPRSINHGRDAELWYHNTLICVRNSNNVLRHITGISATGDGRSYNYTGVTLPTFSTVPEQVSGQLFGSFFREREFTSRAFVAPERRIVLPTRLYYLEALNYFIKVTHTERHTYRRSMSLQSVSLQATTPAELARSFWNNINQQRAPIRVHQSTGSFFIELPPQWFLVEVDSEPAEPSRGLLITSELNNALNARNPTPPSLSPRRVSLPRTAELPDLIVYLRNQLRDKFPSLQENQQNGRNVYLRTAGYQAVLLDSLNLPHFTISAQEMLTTHPVDVAGLVEGNILYLPLHPHLTREELAQCPVPYGVLLDSTGIGLGYVATHIDRPVSRYLDMLNTSRSAA